MANFRFQDYSRKVRENILIIDGKDEPLIKVHDSEYLIQSRMMINRINDKEICNEYIQNLKDIYQDKTPKEQEHAEALINKLEDSKDIDSKVKIAIGGVQQEVDVNDKDSVIRKFTNVKSELKNNIEDISDIIDNISEDPTNISIDDMKAIDDMLSLMPEFGNSSKDLQDEGMSLLLKGIEGQRKIDKMKERLEEKLEELQAEREAMEKAFKEQEDIYNKALEGINDSFSSMVEATREVYMQYHADNKLGYNKDGILQIEGNKLSDIPKDDDRRQNFDKALTGKTNGKESWKLLQEKLVERLKLDDKDITLTESQALLKNAQTYEDFTKAMEQEGICVTRFKTTSAKFPAKDGVNSNDGFTVKKEVPVLDEDGQPVFKTYLEGDKKGQFELDEKGNKIPETKKISISMRERQDGTLDIANTKDLDRNKNKDILEGLQKNIETTKDPSVSKQEITTMYLYDENVEIGNITQKDVTINLAQELERPVSLTIGMEKEPEQKQAQDLTIGMDDISDIETLTQSMGSESESMKNNHQLKNKSDMETSNQYNEIASSIADNLDLSAFKQQSNKQQKEVEPQERKRSGGLSQW